MKHKKYKFNQIMIIKSKIKSKILKTNKKLLLMNTNKK
jgi:hypothetical protein